MLFIAVGLKVQGIIAFNNREVPSRKILGSTQRLSIFTFPDVIIDGCNYHDPKKHEEDKKKNIEVANPRYIYYIHVHIKKRKMY